MNTVATPVDAIVDLSPLATLQSETAAMLSRLKAGEDVAEAEYVELFDRSFDVAADLARGVIDKTATVEDHLAGNGLCTSTYGNAIYQGLVPLFNIISGRFRLVEEWGRLYPEWER